MLQQIIKALFVLIFAGAAAVSYKFQAAPGPGSLVLLGGALIGVGVIRPRQRHDLRGQHK